MSALLRNGTVAFVLGLFACAVACAGSANERSVAPGSATPSPVGAGVPPIPGADDGGAAAALNAELGRLATPLDSGLAWCTAPAPDDVRSTAALSPTTAMRVYAGRCMPTDHYYRACDDAGLPIYVPPCGDENTGTHLDIATAGHVTVSVSAHAIDVAEGPMPGAAWAIGPQERAIIAKVQTKIGGTLRDDMRVVATTFKPDDWHLPSEDFGDVVVNPTAGTFTFWRKAVCVEPVGCAVARWEASRAGVRMVASEKDVYLAARARLRSELVVARDKAPVCPVPVILMAARIYGISRILGEPEKTAMGEFDRLVAGLSTARCVGGASAHQKPLGAIRQEIAKGMKQFLATGGRSSK